MNINFFIIIITFAATIASCVIGLQIDKNCDLVSTTNNYLFGSIIALSSALFLVGIWFAIVKKSLSENVVYPIAFMSCILLITAGATGWNSLNKCVDSESSRRAINYLTLFICTTFAGIIGLGVIITANFYCNKNNLNNNNQITINRLRNEKELAIQDCNNQAEQLKRKHKLEISALEFKGEEMAQKCSQEKKTCNKVKQLCGNCPKDPFNVNPDIPEKRGNPFFKFKQNKRNSKKKPKRKKTKRKSKRR